MIAAWVLFALWGLIVLMVIGSGMSKEQIGERAHHQRIVLQWSLLWISLAVLAAAVTLASVAAVAL